MPYLPYKGPNWLQWPQRLPLHPIFTLPPAWAFLKHVTVLFPNLLGLPIFHTISPLFSPPPPLPLFVSSLFLNF